ncbi:MAG: DUF4258 domain-containing protein [Chloroflexi bacterium]|nr:DUF4258 domain-containing protein [Chloroflexota bacterium]
MEERSISVLEIELVLSSPSKVAPGRRDAYVASAQIAGRNLTVVYSRKGEGYLIITVY